MRPKRITSIKRESVCVVITRDIVWEIWISLDQIRFDGKKKKLPEVRSGDEQCTDRISFLQIFQGLSLENGVDIWSFLRESV